jgi:lipopolysaccharide biosynthesis glycosyltransferase
MIYSATLYKKETTLISLGVGLWSKQGTNLSPVSRNRIEKICKALEISLSFITLKEFTETHFDTFGRIIPLDANLARLDYCINSNEDFLHFDVDLILQPGWDELLSLPKVQDGAAISAVPDLDSWGNISLRRDINHPQHWVCGSDESNFYFNAGVFIFHYQGWNAQNLNDVLMQTLSEIDSRKMHTHFGDQDILNFVTNGFKNRLPSRYNLLVNEVVGQPSINNYFIPKNELQPRILHFAGPSKPWKHDLEHISNILRVNDYNSSRGYVDTLMNYFMPYYFIQNQRKIWAHNTL